MILIGSILLIIYLIVMGLLLYGYQKVPTFHLKPSTKKNLPSTRFTIIIPFRDEEKNLPALLKSINELEYPLALFEVIFVDDFSEDNSVAVIYSKNKRSNINVISNNITSSSPKKDAITEAIKLSKHEWIITTDADCVLPKKWLIAFNELIVKSNPVMIAGPVRYFTGNGLINKYQQLDNFSLQTTTVAMFGLNDPILSNGANFAYLKEEFIAVSGFKGNNNIASGDDIFLLEKFKKRNLRRIHFIKSWDSIVLTKPQKNWNTIVTQRIRWASKTSKQNNATTKILGLIVFFTNLFMAVSIIYLFTNSFMLPFLLLFLFFKFLIDYLIINESRKFFNQKIDFSSYIISQFIYPFLTVIVFLRSLSGAYKWKGRSFNK